MSYLNLSPNPAALVESMRDIGYSMETAIADLIDNSITANATKIDIHFSWSDGEPWLSIIDNGHGMSGDMLTNAMRLGSQNPLEQRAVSDLGRFGLGLKTASFSQCRKLTVISSWQGNIEGREWDLDVIARESNDEWKLRILNEEELNSLLLSYNIEQQGTVVLWRNMDTSL